MSLFSGFSTAGDEERAMRLSRLMTERTHLLMASAIRLHRPDKARLGDVYEEDANGEPVRRCHECLKPWPCPTWNTLTNAEENEP